MIMNNQLLSAKELANLLSVSTRTVWRLRSAGALPEPVTVGSSRRWRASDVSEWIEAGCPKTV
ncbi:MAG: DNA-binding protein [Planctomycetes bacterium B3_Pla]|nr:MAG: DNA-binding protein [Planctomycetes bacterium B3_Pla]